MNFKKILHPIEDKWIFANTLLWGFVLWLVGYILGIILFAFVPENLIGWVILPIGLLLMLYVLFKKIERKTLMCYFMLGVFWAGLAIIMDFIFIVQLFNSSSYYKPDVYIYYLLTFSLPAIIGWYKLKN